MIAVKYYERFITEKQACRTGDKSLILCKKISGYNIQCLVICVKHPVLRKFITLRMHTKLRIFIDVCEGKVT
jgi:hypothetical protein